MKNLLFTLIFLFFAVLGFSQSAPCTVTNTINSGTVRVQLFASPVGGCQVVCAIPTFCLLPGETKTIPPCFPGFFAEWSYAIVTPTTDECSTACPPASITFVSQNGCVPPFDSSIHCHAGPYSTFFSGPNTLDIF